MKGIDVQVDTTGKGEQLKEIGVEFVGLYLRQDRTSAAMCMDLAHHGIKRLSIYEKGYPTSRAYFVAAQGGTDAARAVAVARLVGMPAGEIFFCVDYDASVSDLDAIDAYFVAARKVLSGTGYLASIYGSGMVCNHLVNKGLAHSGYLSGSKGWAGYAMFLPKAAVVQGAEITNFCGGLDVDLDTISAGHEGVLW